MFITKEQIFLAYCLIICSLSLVASAGDPQQTPGYFARAKHWLTGKPQSQQPQPKPLHVGTELEAALEGILPAGPLGVIKEYAEEYLPYIPIRTFATPPKLYALGFDDHTKNLTLVSTQATQFVVTIYNIQTGDIRKQFTINKNDAVWHRYHIVLLSGNGKILISNNDVFDTGTGAIIYQIPDIRIPNVDLEDYYRPLDLNHDGSVLILAPHPRRDIPAPLIFLNLETKVLVDADFIYYARERQPVSFSHDGKTVASIIIKNYANNTQDIVLLDVATGKRKNIIPINPQAKHISRSIVLNNDASLLAYTITDQNTRGVNLVDTHTGAIIHNITSNGQEDIVGFNRDNNVYVIAQTKGSSSSSLKLWNPETGSLTKIIELGNRGHNKPIISANDRFVILEHHPDSIEILQRSTQTEIDREEREQKREQTRELEMKQDVQRIEQARLREQQQRNLEDLTPAVEDVD